MIKIGDEAFINPNKICVLCGAREVIELVTGGTITNLILADSVWVCKDRKDCINARYGNRMIFTRIYDENNKHKGTVVKLDGEEVLEVIKK